MLVFIDWLYLPCIGDLEAKIRLSFRYQQLWCDLQHFSTRHLQQNPLLTRVLTANYFTQRDKT